MALPSLSPFAPCPSCGGWARRPLAPRESRAHCKGCGWRGSLDARIAGGPAPTHESGPAAATHPGPRGPTDSSPGRAFPPPSITAWRLSRFHS